ncbi:hypothetical protein CPB97_007603, partial [Podila verticillata]
MSRPSPASSYLILGRHFLHGKAKCEQIRRKDKHTYPPTESHAINPRFVNGITPMLFKSGYNFEDENEGFKGDQLFDQGIIAQVGGEIEVPRAQPLWISRDVSLRPAFNPSDPACMWVLSGDVTSTLILPESSNIMGGEAYTIKLRKVDTLSTNDMLVEAGVEDEWRSFAKDTKLKDDQNDWCRAVKSLSKYGRRCLDIPFPEDLQYESLVAVLHDDAKFNIHCYETHDLEVMVRHSNEYKFKISAFHHGVDAYRVPEIMKRAYKVVPTVATFAGNYKKEAFQSSINAPKILADADIAVAMKSDHSVLNSQHLVYEAAMARHYSFSEKLALASVTTVLAKALGLNHRIGKIAIGMDADVVIWQKHPLAPGSHPLQIENMDESKWSKQGKPQEFEEYPKLVAPKVKAACTPNAEMGVFSGIKKILLKDSEEFSAKGDLTMVIAHGEVVCAGHCAHEAAAFKDAPVYDLGGEGVVVTPILSIGAPGLGLIEIRIEDSTGDGHHNLQPDIAYAIDGLKFGGLHMDEAYKASIQVAVTAPQSENVIQGVSVAFLTGAENALIIKGAIIKEMVALHIRIGQDSKSALFPTISSQIGFLRTRAPTSNSRSWPLTVAGYLAKAEIGVIFKPYLCTPVQWTAQKCLPGAPLSNETGLSHLHKAGVK